MILLLHQKVQDRFRSVLKTLYDLSPELCPNITIQYPPSRPLGDLAITVAFELAKTLRKPPRAIAEEIVEALGHIEGVAKAEATKSGYVNIYLDRAKYLRSVLESPPNSLSSEPDEAQKIIVEHTAINPNKAAHIGHLRNAALGDTLVRLLRFSGQAVEIQNYIDDTGVQVADVVVGFEQLESKSLEDVRLLCDLPHFDYYCWDLYAKVTEWYEADPTRLEIRKKALQDLERGGNPSAELASLIADRIVRYHLATMDRLNVEYDLLSWEGDILKLDFWETAFDLLKEAGVLFLQPTGPQAGCWVMEIREDRPDDSTDPRYKVVVRSDGTVTYVGKDIAYQFWKFGLIGKNFKFHPYLTQRSGRTLWTTATEGDGNHHTSPRFGHASAVFNVIDTRQAYLQKLLRQALTAAGHNEQAEKSVHFSYEMVALSHSTAAHLGYEDSASTNRPFVEVSGRKGLGVKADDLLDLLTKAAAHEVRARNKELTDTEVHEIATAIGIAAVRYFMIKYSRGKVIAFDIDEALSFEGESGPYLQYAAVRAGNILRKLKAKDDIDSAYIIEQLPSLSLSSLEDPDGTDLWGLVLEASRLEEVAEQAIRTLELSSLAKYAFTLAQSFNGFYHRYPVLKESDVDVRLWRAAVVVYVRNQLSKALELMGCEVPTRM